jgi:hypothetical protein
MVQKVWLITGFSRGLGRSLAKAVLAKGDLVIGTTRRGEQPDGLAGDNLSVLPLEMTDHDQVARTAAAAFSRHGRLAVIVNNAGYTTISERVNLVTSAIREVGLAVSTDGGQLEPSLSARSRRMMFADPRWSRSRSFYSNKHVSELFRHKSPRSRLADQPPPQKVLLRRANEGEKEKSARKLMSGRESTGRDR